MSTRSWSAVGLSWVVALTACSPVTRAPATWRFAIEETEGSVQALYAHRFADRIAERTNGEVRVVVYPYGALGTSDQITEQLHNGTLDLAMSSPGHLGKLIPEVQVFLLHFVLSNNTRVNARALRDASLRAYLDELYAQKGLAFLTAFGEGEMVWTTHSEIRRPEDFEGLRMRVMTSPLLLASYEAYGATPTPLPYSDVYAALQLHMIDGQVNPISAIEEMGFYEVTDVLTFPGHAEFVTTLAANPRFVHSLRPAHARALRTVIETLQSEIERVQAQENAARIEAMLQRRPALRVVHLDEAERARFRDRARRARQTFLEQAGARGAELLEILERAVSSAEQAPQTR